MQTDSTKPLRVVIAGGGTAGWLAASALSQQMGGLVEITLVESSEIGTVGVGEATIPPMKTFHRLLRINEQEFMKATHATFKLGIQFENWKNGRDTYFHSFGETGKQTLITEFIHFWQRGKALGFSKGFSDYCIEYRAAMENRMSTLSDTTINHAYHLDAGLYATFLAQIAKAGGVKRVDGKIAQVQQDSSTGNITTLLLDSGEAVHGDFFIDCTGFKGLLIEKTLRTGFEDWSHWLPCDSAIAVQTESSGAPSPYTRSIAHSAGWRWRIPLQHRVGNGIVFSRDYLSEDEATDSLLKSVDGKLITSPKVIHFRTGKRRKSWNKNCVAVGLSSGFLEPLESTSIHLVMTAVTRILQLFPHGNIQQSVIDEYNAQADSEMEKIRDFIILHYKATEREDSKFWQYCKNMDVPEELAHRIRLFRQAGKSYQTEGELFRLDSWTQVMLGQGIEPEKFHPIVMAMRPQELKQFLNSVENHVSRTVEKLPMHDQFLKQYCDIHVPITD